MITGFGARAASRQTLFRVVAMPPATATAGSRRDYSLDCTVQNAGLGTATKASV